MYQYQTIMSVAKAYYKQYLGYQKKKLKPFKLMVFSSVSLKCPYLNGFCHVHYI